MNKTPEKGILWLVLDNASQAALKARCQPMYEDVFCHHVTLAYGIEPRDPRIAEFAGQTHTVASYAHARNGKVQAVRVRTGGLPDTYGVPHVTISADNVPPYESVAMLQSEHTEVPLDPPLMLSGTVEYAPL